MLSPRAWKCGYHSKRVAQAVKDYRGLLFLLFNWPQALVFSASLGSINFEFDKYDYALNTD
jgi:hypothetical protein